MLRCLSRWLSAGECPFDTKNTASYADNLDSQECALGHGTA